MHKTLNEVYFLIKVLALKRVKNKKQIHLLAHDSVFSSLLHV